MTGSIHISQNVVLFLHRAIYYVLKRHLESSETWMPERFKRANLLINCLKPMHWACSLKVRHGGKTKDYHREMRTPTFDFGI